eukprot:scaffold1734_cov113-Isochrysis_galbana.AAC.18
MTILSDPLSWSCTATPQSSVESPLRFSQLRRRGRRRPSSAVVGRLAATGSTLTGLQAATQVLVPIAYNRTIANRMHVQ